MTLLTRVLAATAAGAAVALATIAPAGPAGAAATHIGIAVRFPGGASQTACTTTGGTGLAVLERRFGVTVGQSGPYAGFVLTINGQGQSPPNTTHYWSYWHKTGSGSWTYSSSGAGSYHPAAGAVEGWSYVNGTSSPPQPPAVTYSSVCGSSDVTPKPTPTPGPTHRSTPPPTTTTTTSGPTHAHPAPHRSTTHHARPAASPDAAHRPVRTTGPASAAGSATRASSAAARPAASATRRSSSAADVAAAPNATGSPVAGAIRAADPRAAKSAAGFPAWVTALAVLVVVALGALAWLRTRRQSE